MNNPTKTESNGNVIILDQPDDRLSKVPDMGKVPAGDAPPKEPHQIDYIPDGIENETQFAELLSDSYEILEGIRNRHNTYIDSLKSQLDNLTSRNYWADVPMPDTSQEWESRIMEVLFEIDFYNKSTSRLNAASFSFDSGSQFGEDSPQVSGVRSATQTAQQGSVWGFAKKVYCAISRRC